MTDNQDTPAPGFFARTIKAWVASGGTAVTSFIAQVLAQPSTQEAINNAISAGFSWGEATLKSIVAAAIVYLLTYLSPKNADPAPKP